MASARMKPPKNKNIWGFAYDIAVSLSEEICSRGKATRGMRAVTGKGTASVPHQAAISNATAATCQPSTDKDSGVGFKITEKNKSKPTQKPNFL